MSRVTMHRHCSRAIRARVIFKTERGCAIVDPWKPETRVKPPQVIEDTFNSEPAWIERDPEQCGESSCSIIAMTRAVIISIAAFEARARCPDMSMKIAAKSYMLDVHLHGPLAVALVRCAHSVVARDRAAPMREVFQT